MAMTVPIDLPQRIKQIVGPLPPPGQLPGDGSYPYETVVPLARRIRRARGGALVFRCVGRERPLYCFCPSLPDWPHASPQSHRAVPFATLSGGDDGSAGEWTFRSTSGASCLQLRSVLR